MVGWTKVGAIIAAARILRDTAVPSQRFLTHDDHPRNHCPSHHRSFAGANQQRQRWRAGGPVAHLGGWGRDQLVLDFAALDYISSAGLRLVLVLAKRLKQERGRLVLCAMQPHVHEVFDISGFLAILDVQATRQEALARL